MSPVHPRLFQPFAFKNGLTLRNRAVMAPMTTWSANPDATVSDQELAYYRARVQGVGMVVTGCTHVTPDGIGFSVEGFPTENFSGSPANVLGLQTLAAAPTYRSNCFIGALSQPVNWQVSLVQGGTETVLGSTSGTLAAFETTRILDVFNAVGVSGDFSNVTAKFSTPDNPAPPFVGFCTLETSSNGSAGSRGAKATRATYN